MIHLEDEVVMKSGAWGLLGGILGFLLALAFVLTGHFIALR